jgi:predicted phosphodiesterase
LRYAIISDIHSNLEALESVLREIGDCSADRIICLGDIVGYGANPNECVEIIKRLNITSLIGNHDKAACGLTEPVGFNPAARQAALWTRKELTGENKDYLKSLPDEDEADGFMIVHGAPSDPDKYILSAYDAAPEFPLMGKMSICFFGHTHVSGAFTLADGAVGFSRDERLQLRTGTKYLVNPGSVGQPRDRDPRASFLIYDDRGSAEFRRAGYPVEIAQKKIIDSGLDPFLAERLSYGY